MEITVEVISQETVKPSSPNPKPRSKYNLSFLDQMAPPVFMPLIYFYPPDNNTIDNSEKINELKKSLSQALTTFYPLSGRLANDGSYVHCTNQGAPFIEAKANCDLSRVIADPDPQNMDRFLPYKVDRAGNLGMAVQVTHLTCGGIAVALVISHKIADALSYFLFANAWAEIARHGPGHEPSRMPIFGADSIFPPQELSGFRPDTGMQERELLETKIFTFGPSKISALRDRYSGGADRATRVEALSAYIWARFVASIETKPDPNKMYSVVHMINLRNRLEPPLSERHFGNISRIAVAMPEVVDGELRLEDGPEMLEKLRESIRAVDRDYVDNLKSSSEKHLSYMKEMMIRTVRGEIVTLNFTSLCRFPLYEADFGWGKPVWVGSAGFGYKNLVMFIDEADGDGIEAWITLRKEDMEKFEADLEVQEFTAKDNKRNLSVVEICV